MVDGSLPIEKSERGLRYLFLDLNSYFASVEQQEHPELRGKPVAVVPVEADTSFVIAASYEAKAFGVRTGTRIGDAKTMCPGLICTKGNHTIYAAYHRAVLKEVENVLPVEQVCSIDEMRFRLIGDERRPNRARELGLELKHALRTHLGECMTASIGIAPNPFLAKIGTEIQKPDGLVVLQASDLPDRLYCLKLTDFTGINVRMKARLNGAGIFTAEDLCRASKTELRNAFQSVVGERWWYMLRGFDMAADPTHRKSLGHSHVLAPELRTDQGCFEVLQRLLAKAAARLRSEGLWTGTMIISVSAFTRSWSEMVHMPPTQDSVTLGDFLKAMWVKRDYEKPRGVAVTFADLRASGEFTPSLFDPTMERSQLSHAVDGMNQKFGKNSVFIAGMEKVRDTADERIAFNKTWLFSEGKGDYELDEDELIDTFRGRPYSP